MFRWFAYEMKKLRFLDCFQKSSKKVYLYSKNVNFFLIFLLNQLVWIQIKSCELMVSAVIHADGSVVFDISYVVQYLVLIFSRDHIHLIFASHNGECFFRDFVYFFRFLKSKVKITIFIVCSHWTRIQLWFFKAVLDVSSFLENVACSGNVFFKYIY